MPISLFAVTDHHLTPSQILDLGLVLNEDKVLRQFYTFPWPRKEKGMPDWREIYDEATLEYKWKKARGEQPLSEEEEENMPFVYWWQFPTFFNYVDFNEKTVVFHAFDIELWALDPENRQWEDMREKYSRILSFYDRLGQIMQEKYFIVFTDGRSSWIESMIGENRTLDEIRTAILQRTGSNRIEDITDKWLGDHHIYIHTVKR
ncbi:hypothetical protein [Chitinophaga flava]|uniref:Uncharacterized protein n=1 Tax=Chitinophaga flava TaxID=2259036 RepID=A0A365Y5Y1_9BACT|nr:hypothetical protein [Chitinophaga flava]RBL93919.1 hypothetical protein DF182_15645 [Chitinophaga flava]